MLDQRPIILKVQKINSSNYEEFELSDTELREELTTEIPNSTVFIDENQDLQMDFDENIEEEEEENCNFFSEYEESTQEDLQSNGDVLKLVLAFYLKHNLSWSALEDLLELIKAVKADITLPCSKYIFKKWFMNKKPELHIICRYCDFYLGKEKHLSEVVQCENCEKEVNTKKDAKFFIYQPLREQLENLAKTHASSLIFHQSSQESVIDDVRSGILYKKFVAAHPGEKFLTLTVNTDGAKKHKSKKSGSIWALQVVVNELPPNLRFEWENMVLAGLWFGSEPDVSTYFKPMIEEIKSFERDPLNIQINDETVELKVMPLVFPVDSPARSMLQEVKQFNGYFGCSFCLHPGIHISLL